MNPMRETVAGGRVSQATGFTLIEIAVVMVVLSLLLAMIAGIATAMVGQQRREATRQRLAGVETAIAIFVSQNKRMPCPADGQTPGTTAGAGVEARNSGTGACNIDNFNFNHTRGGVPWITRGRAEPDTTDGWGNRLTYRVAPELAIDNAMDLTACDPGGSGSLYYNLYTGTPGVCNPTTSPSPPNTATTPCSTTNFPDNCTPPATYTQNKGLKIRTNSTTVTLTMSPTAIPSTGAAYVVISHGENGEGAYNNQGVLQSGSTASGALETSNNWASVAFAYNSSTAIPDTSAIVDDFPSYLADSSHFDDFVLRPAILMVAMKAQLGPRAH